MEKINKPLTWELNCCCLELILFMKYVFGSHVTSGLIIFMIADSIATVHGGHMFNYERYMYGQVEKP